MRFLLKILFRALGYPGHYIQILGLRQEEVKRIFELKNFENSKKFSADKAVVWWNWLFN